jgi:hypothetical protein
MIDYQVAIESGMRVAVKGILTQVQKFGIGNSEIIIKIHPLTEPGDSWQVILRYKYHLKQLPVLWIQLRIF